MSSTYPSLPAPQAGLSWDDALSRAATALSTAEHAIGGQPPPSDILEKALTLARDGSVELQADGSFRVRSSQRQANGSRSNTWYTVETLGGSTHVQCACTQGTLGHGLCAHRLARTLYLHAKELQQGAVTPGPWEETELAQALGIESDASPDPAHPTFRVLLEQAEASAHHRLPQSASRIHAAVALVSHGKVLQTDQGLWVVEDEDAGAVYVASACVCDDRAIAPHGFCKHRIAVGLQRRVLQELGQALAETAPHTPHAQPVHVDVHLPSTEALPEAPASANVRVLLDGYDVQLTLRDRSEERLIERLRFVLATPGIARQGGAHLPGAPTQVRQTEQMGLRPGTPPGSAPAGDPGDWEAPQGYEEDLERPSHSDVRPTGVRPTRPPLSPRDDALPTYGDMPPMSDYCELHQKVMRVRTGKGGDTWTSHENGTDPSGKPIYCKGKRAAR